jgi:hypothetical protein
MKWNWIGDQPIASQLVMGVPGYCAEFWCLYRFGAWRCRWSFDRERWVCHDGMIPVSLLESLVVSYRLGEGVVDEIWK